MKAIILAGGLGTRLAEETSSKPKPMIRIGNYPLIWHIMKIYYHYSIKEFIIALGYKGEEIKKYFLEYRNLKTNITIDFKKINLIKHHNQKIENWKIHLLDTGEFTQTGGRIKQSIVFAKQQTILATYGDGLANIDISKLIKFHKSQKKIATITAVRPPSRFGKITLQNNLVTKFEEKPQLGEGWINGGFFVFEPEVADYIENESISLEEKPLENLSKDKQLAVYRHEGFWQPCDVLRDKHLLENYWLNDNPPWKIWD